MIANSGLNQGSATGFSFADANAAPSVLAGGIPPGYRPPGRPWNNINPMTLATSVAKIHATIIQNALRHSRLLSSVVLGIRSPQASI
jgi:hypothetical protein